MWSWEGAALCSVRQGQLGAAPAHVKIGVTPAVQLGGTTQGLAGASAVGILSGVMDD